MDLRDKLSSLDVPPGKILKVVIALSVILLLIWLLTLSHIDYNQGPETNQYINTEQSVDSVDAQTDSSGIKPARSYEQTSNIFNNGLITFFVLLIMLIMVWLWLDRKKIQGAKKVNRELDTEVLGEGAKLKIIRLNKEIWVLGVTSGSVNLLHRYKERDWNEKMPDEGTDDRDMFRKLFKSQL